MVTLIGLTLGSAVLGIASAKSSIFCKGGGIVLIQLSHIAILLAAVAGALSASIPSLAILALCLLAFVFGVFVTSHSYSS